ARAVLVRGVVPLLRRDEARARRLRDPAVEDGGAAGPGLHRDPLEGHTPVKPGVTVEDPFHEARRTSGLRDRALRTVYAQTGPVHLQLAEDIHHKGAPATRQAGLDLVDTEWTAFLDSDDDLDPDHIEQLLACAKDTGADYVYPWFRVKGGTDPFPMFFRQPWD